MFDVLKIHGLYAIISKCQFVCTYFEYLGHVLYNEGISVDPKKIKTVVRRPVPKDNNEVNHLLGLATYMVKYVMNFAKIAVHVTNLLKGKFKTITWVHDCHESFEALKKTLTEAMILRIIDTLKGKLVLCTNPSNMAIWVVLTQEYMLIAYESNKLNNAKLNYHVHEKGLLAIIPALKVWRHYLLCSEFKMETNP